MRVLFCSSALTHRGGAHRWLLAVLARLQGQAETLLCVGRVDPRLPPEEGRAVGPVRRVKGLGRRGPERRGLQRALAGLRQAVADFDPQVIHANDLVDPDLLALVAGSGRGLMTVQDHRFFCAARGKVDAAGRPCRRPLGQACAGCFDDPDHAQAMVTLTRARLAALAGMARVTVLSGYMRRELLALGTLEPGRVRVLPPFVDGLPAPASSRAHRGAHHLLAGRLARPKGVDLALEAAALQGSDGLPLVVAGEGPLAEEVGRAAARPGAGVRHTPGWADRAGVARLLAGARSLWLPGTWAEPFGIVGLEALQQGVPVIAADTGGVGDWLAHGEQGLLVPPGDAGALAAAARRLGGDPALARQLGEAGRRRVERDFAPAALMDRLLALYGELGQRRVTYCN